MVTILIIRQLKIMTKHVPDNQSLVFSWAMATWKKYSVLLDNNIKSHTVLFKFRDMVEAITHFPCTNIIVPLTEIFEGTTVP